MSWIKTIDPEEADEQLEQAYSEVGASRGRVAHILGIHSLSPKTMLTHLDLYKQIMFARSELSRPDRELVAVAVSSVNHCHY